MLQIYHFYGYDNMQAAYDQLNRFLVDVSEIGVYVPNENVAVNTKTYPDHGTTATTITVALYFHQNKDLVSQVRELHQSVVSSQPSSAGAGADEGLKLGKGHRLELSLDTDGWLLVDCHEDRRQVVFRDVQSPDVLESIRHHLKRDPADDFDPFLDSGDLL